MKTLGRFLLSSIIVLCAVIAIDFVSGKVLGWMLPQISPRTAVGKTEFALNEVSTPVVIVGSSRASHHYVTQMVEDSLGLEAYNVGRDGCYLGYNICVINSILDRYSPEIIIWENSSSSLYAGSDDPLESLYPYYGNNPWVTEVVNSGENGSVRLCLRSSLYRYNSMIIRVTMRWFGKSDGIDIDKGYDPLVPKKWIVREDAGQESKCNDLLDSHKVAMLEDIFQKAQTRGVKLIMAESPIYSDSYAGEPSLSLAETEVEKLAVEYGVRYIDNRGMREFVGHPEYFNDRTHLNRTGAELYTRLFLEQLKNILNQNNYEGN